MYLKKKYIFLAVLIGLILTITACTGKTQSIPDVTPTPSNAEATVTPAKAETEPAETNIGHDYVFNTKDDEGKLVARFFYLPSEAVRSGDSIFLKAPDGKTMLIDGGTVSVGSQVVSYLEELGVKKIDYLVISHPHSDHIGGLTAVADKFEVGKVYRSVLDDLTSSSKAFYDKVEEKKIETLFLSEGMEFDFGSKVKVKVYNPGKIEQIEGEANDPTAVVNGYSLVLKMIYDGASMLFPGDVYAAREADLVVRYGDELQADVLKVPHHGYDTSSSEIFVDAVNPKIAVICYNRVASMTKINSYRKKCDQMFHTALDGCIKVSTDGKAYEYASEK